MHKKPKQPPPKPVSAYQISPSKITALESVTVSYPIGGITTARHTKIKR
jgi:hypothetical protein